MKNLQRKVVFKITGVKKTRNQTFQYLKALTILMVIDDHMSTRIGILSSIFPYNSFYMPLFVFISGYFWKKQPISKNLYRKTRKLLIPYIIWNMIGEFIAFVLMQRHIVYWYQEISLNSFFESLMYRPLSSINGASWFVIMLFYVSIFYNLLRNIFLKQNLKTDSFLIILLTISGFFAIYACMKGFNNNLYFLVIFRMIFYIQFYHIGYYFQKYLEKYIQALNKLIVCCLCILINVILICIYGDKINFYSTSGMGQFNSWYLPLLTSLTGILFWYEIMSFLSQKIGASNIIDFIADNTFVIMESHLLFINLPNFYVLYRIKQGSPNFFDFEIDKFQNSAWFRYNSPTRLAGFFCGICGSLLISYIIYSLKKKYTTFHPKTLVRDQ